MCQDRHQLISHNRPLRIFAGLPFINVLLIFLGRFRTFFRSEGVLRHPAERKRQAEKWCDDFRANNERWLKSTIATWKEDRPELTYEDVNTSLIPPRPRLYGLRGAEIIEEVWRQREAQLAVS